MKALALHTGAPTVHWKDNTSFISFVDEGHVMLMEAQPIIIFHMKSLSEKVYQHF